MKTFLCIIALSLTASAGFNILTNCAGCWHYGDTTHIRTTDDGIGCYSNLVAWYMFDRTNSPCAKWGTNAVDYSVSKSPATVFVGTSSGATWVASSVPTSSFYSFDGNDCIDVGIVGKTTSSFSTCAWFLPVISSQFHIVVSEERVGGIRSYNLGLLNMFPRISQLSNGVLVSVNAPLNVAPNKWLHLCYCYNNAGKDSLFVNGNLLLNVECGNVMTLYDGIRKIGCRVSGQTNGYFATGYIDDVRNYTGVLSSDDVTNLFNATRAAHPNS